MRGASLEVFSHFWPGSPCGSPIPTWRPPLEPLDLTRAFAPRFAAAATPSSQQDRCPRSVAAEHGEAARGPSCPRPRTGKRFAIPITAKCLSRVHVTHALRIVRTPRRCDIWWACWRCLRVSRRPALRLEKGAWACEVRAKSGGSAIYPGSSGHSARRAVAHGCSGRSTSLAVRSAPSRPSARSAASGDRFGLLSTQ